MAGLKELEDRFLIRGEYAGLHVLLTHRQGEAEESLVARAAELGVKVYGISGCFIQPEEKLFDSTVMLGYAVSARRKSEMALSYWLRPGRFKVLHGFFRRQAG